MIIAVYGLGRFGRFWAEFLAAQGFDVRAANRTPREAPPLVTLAPLEELCRAHALFLCTSISSLPQVASRIAPLLAPETLVLDTCSVKTWPLAQLGQILPAAQPILGTHPMFGPDSADQKNSPIVLTPWRVGQKVLERWKSIFTEAGLRVLVMNADEHDREAARTQGVTHFIGRLVSSLNIHPSSISTLGFQKILEVMEQTCNDPVQLFLDLQRYNPHTAEIRRQMVEQFNNIIRLLDNDLSNEYDDDKMTAID